MKEWKILSSLEEWEFVSRKIEDELKRNGFSEKFVTSFLLATDEIFANISMYAYDGQGDVIIKSSVTLSKSERMIEISFCDFGKKFDPTQTNIDINKEEKNVANRKIGGLGIFLCRKQVDEMKYSYINNSNNLVLIKKESI